MQIIIGADVVQTSSNHDEFVGGEIEQLFGKALYEKLQNSDLNIFNLEGALLDEGEKLEKDTSPNIKSCEQSINLLKKINNLVVSGANNHILDYKDTGVDRTIDILRKEKIEFLGFGRNEQEIQKSVFCEYKNKKIGIYSFAENEFSVDRINGRGANGYNEFTTIDAIRENASKCDFLIVLYHGGREDYRYPTPRVQVLSRKIIESGADLVVCQHSHCVGCYEDYKGKKIIYGQGNTIFDCNDREAWKTSVWISVNLDGEAVQYEYIPIQKVDNGIRLSMDRSILEGFETRSVEIKETDFVRKKWEDFCISQADLLLLYGVFGVHNRIVRKIDRITGHQLLKYKLRNLKKRLTLLNYIRCESIRESLIDVLNSRLFD